MKNIDFKKLSKREQNIIYHYNSVVYIDKKEDSSRFLELQKIYQSNAINKYGVNLSDSSLQKVNTYIEEHRKYL